MTSGNALLAPPETDGGALYQRTIQRAFQAAQAGKLPRCSSGRFLALVAAGRSLSAQHGANWQGVSDEAYNIAREIERMAFNFAGEPDRETAAAA